MKLIILLTLLLTSSAMAQPTAPVTHKHGSRTHTHSLPSSGLNHQHGGGNKQNTSNNKPSPKWDRIATSVGQFPTYYSAKAGSLRKVNNQVTVIGEANNTLTHKVNLYKWSVSIRDCNNQMGVLKFYKLNGEFAFKADFVSGGSSVASGIAGTICRAAK